jgi:hypothetical protein
MDTTDVGHYGAAIGLLIRLQQPDSEKFASDFRMNECGRRTLIAFLFEEPAGNRTCAGPYGNREGPEG